MESSSRNSPFGIGIRTRCAAQESRVAAQRMVVKRLTTHPLRIRMDDVIPEGHATAELPAGPYAGVSQMDRRPF
jgi:hypothetical protein